ncbi:hypothetical protein D3C73_1489210 [compost metagenome]
MDGANQVGDAHEQPRDASQNIRVHQMAVDHVGPRSPNDTGQANYGSGVRHALLHAEADDIDPQFPKLL